MFRKKILIISILILGVAVGFYKWFDYRQKWETGYCFEEKRYLTNRQLSDVAITQLLDNLEYEFQQLSNTERENTIQYKSLDDFYRRNPDCCKMFSYSPEHKSAWYERLERNRESGYIAKYGNQILGYLNYQYKTSGPAIYRGYPIRLSFCGKLHETTGKYAIGIPLSYLPGSLKVDEILQNKSENE